MRNAADKIKWLSTSLIVVTLLTVFWVWPAWNSGSQKWYFGNEGDTISTMFRNTHAPSGQNDPFVFEWSFNQEFLADEPAYQMLSFDDSPWQYHLEWYVSGMGMGMDTAEDPLNGRDVPLSYSLSIGRFDAMTMMWSSYFHAMGVSEGWGSESDPVVIEGEAYSMSMMNGTPLTFSPGDILTAMVVFANMVGYEITIPLNQTCYITSPLSDPGYPGVLLPVPSLSQWGMVTLAVFVAFFSIMVIRRRLRTDNS